MFKSTSTASLSQSGISIHTQANSFQKMLLLLFGLSSSQPPAKKQRREKRKANPVYKKEKTNRKWQDPWKWAASGEERLWLTDDEAQSSIANHRTSLDEQPSSWRELRTMKGPICMNTAQAKKGPSQNDGAWLDKSLTQQQREKMILLLECPCYEGKAILRLQISSKGGDLESINHICLCLNYII